MEATVGIHAVIVNGKLVPQ